MSKSAKGSQHTTQRAGQKARKKASVVKKPKIHAANAKIRKKPEYKSFRLHKSVKRPDLALPSWFAITKKAFKLLRANRKQVVMFLVVYGLLYLVFVRGIVSPVDIDAVKEEVRTVTGGGSSVTTNVTVMSLLFESAFSAGTGVAGLYQTVFILTSSLALIWLFRQQQSGAIVSLKDAYYRGMYPLVPFVLVFMVLVFQALPAVIGNFLFSTVITGGLAVTAFEQLIWILFLITTLLLSFYMISSSVIALFIVTLPEMTPTLALRKAKGLVTFRRAHVLIRVVALMIVVGIMYIGFVLPSIFISTTLAQFALFFWTVAIVPFSVAYLFVLYRELL